MKVRKATKKDLKTLMKIYSETVVDEWKTQYPKMSDKEILKEIGDVKKIFKGFDKQLNSKKDLWIVAIINKKIVGYSYAKIMDKKSAWLMMNYVIKEYRGGGIGKKLTEERMKWLKEKNIKGTYVRTFVKNKRSSNNLRKFGFKPASIIFERVTK